MSVYCVYLLHFNNVPNSFDKVNFEWSGSSPSIPRKARRRGGELLPTERMFTTERICPSGDDTGTSRRRTCVEL